MTTCAFSTLFTRLPSSNTRQSTGIQAPPVVCMSLTRFLDVLGVDTNGVKTSSTVLV